MVESVSDKIMQSLKSADELYHRLVLLVGESGSGKTGILRNVAEKFGTPVINLNLALSTELLELTTRQRSLRLPEILEQILKNSLSPVVLDNSEILFGEDLKQDPLRLLQGISRNRAVVVSWNGAVVDGRLIYAKIGHPEYRAYETVDAVVVCMDGVTTIDSEKIFKKAEH
jgi:AAA+ superfamily predicted ATPase